MRTTKLAIRHRGLRKLRTRAKLLAAICHRINKESPAEGGGATFRVWTTEVSPGSPRRFFARGAAQRATETITSTAVDYRRWLDNSESLPPCHLRELRDTRIAGLGMTGRMRLKRCFSYAIMRHGDAALSVLEGDPISWN